ncbi:MAG: response regulator, partial [Candidatus Omnitrophica bacterium]|nr:response regulator [Candidatus Omnitrophota bacterium]
MKKNILVIDDDSLSQKIIVAALEEEGYAAVASLHFEDALQKARQTLPDLVLIDVVMPDITGFEACRRIKELFQPHPPPVIVMTGKLDAVDPVLARKMGAD